MFTNIQINSAFTLAQHKSSGTHTLRKEKHQLEFNCSLSLPDISESHHIGVQTRPHTRVQPCLFSLFITLQFVPNKKGYTAHIQVHSHVKLTPTPLPVSHAVLPLPIFTICLTPYPTSKSQSDLPCSKNLPLDQVYLVLWSLINTYY